MDRKYLKYKMLFKKYVNTPKKHKDKYLEIMKYINQSVVNKVEDCDQYEKL